MADEMTIGVIVLAGFIVLAEIVQRSLELFVITMAAW